MLSSNYIQTACGSAGGITKLWLAAYTDVTGSTAGTGLEISAFAATGSVFWKFEGFDIGTYEEVKTEGRGKVGYTQTLTVTFNAIPKALLDAVKDLTDECGLVLVWEDGDGITWTAGYGKAGSAPNKPMAGYVNAVTGTTPGDFQENQTEVVTFQVKSVEPKRKFTGNTGSAPFN